jgi:peptidoglycan/LPS O-acetylase OafA/YrhL
VDAFFALSGYLIGNILYRDVSAGSFSLTAFWRRRWRRTVPAYLFFLAVNVLVLGHLTRHFGLDWRFLFYLQNFATPPPANFFPEAWSLSVEEWFYVLAPLMLIGLARFLPPARAFAGVVGLLIGGALLCRLGCVLRFDSPWDAVTRKIVLLRMDAIGVGMGIACLEQRGAFAARCLRRAALGLGGALVVLVLWIYWRIKRSGIAELDHSLYSRTLHHLLCPLGFALTLPAFARIFALPGRALTAGVRWIALISYSMYLSNLMVVLLVTKAGERITLPVPARIAAFWIVTLGISSLTYWFIERPFMVRRQRPVGCLLS